MSQLLTPNTEEFDLVELVKDLLKDLNKQIRNKKISLPFKCKEVSILLFADKLRLNQVFLDILNKAINNIVQEGEIIVSLERQDNDNNTVLVRIIDNGPGTPSNIKDKLFTNFVTGSQSGVARRALLT